MKIHLLHSFLLWQRVVWSVAYSRTFHSKPNNFQGSELYYKMNIWDRSCAWSIEDEMFRRWCLYDSLSSVPFPRRLFFRWQKLTYCILRTSRSAELRKASFLYFRCLYIFGYELYIMTIWGQDEDSLVYLELFVYEYRRERFLRSSKLPMTEGRRTRLEKWHFFRKPDCDRLRCSLTLCSSTTRQFHRVVIFFLRPNLVLLYNHIYTKQFHFALFCSSTYSATNLL